jgi:signal transduction histidine kinase
VDINLGFIAAEVSRARGRAEAAALVLHDLGNQLTGVQGWNRELERGFERARELVASGGTVETPMVESLASHHERLSRCLEASFELLRINRQFLRSYAQEEPAPRGFSIHEILDHVVALAPRASAAVGVRCALPERTCLDFDRSRFVRVLLNLVKNALEASDSSGQEPRVVLEALREGREVVLRVRDEGAGFDETQAKSFFVKGCTSKSEGSGLGLWASRAFVEALGGTLRLESEGPGQGAVATVRLPESLVCQGP